MPGTPVAWNPGTLNAVFIKSDLCACHPVVAARYGICSKLPPLFRGHVPGVTCRVFLPHPRLSISFSESWRRILRPSVAAWLCNCATDTPAPRFRLMWQAVILENLLSEEQHDGEEGVLEAGDEQGAAAGLAPAEVDHTEEKGLARSAGTVAEGSIQELFVANSIEDTGIAEMATTVKHVMGVVSHDRERLTVHRVLGQGKCGTVEEVEFADFPGECFALKTVAKVILLQVARVSLEIDTRQLLLFSKSLACSKREMLFFPLACLPSLPSHSQSNWR